MVVLVRFWVLAVVVVRLALLGGDPFHIGSLARFIRVLSSLAVRLLCSLLPPAWVLSLVVGAVCCLELSAHDRCGRLRGGAIVGLLVGLG